MNQLTLGSLFDGSGGFPLAGAIHGVKPLWASEVEPYPIAVTRTRFPEMKHLGSVTEISGAKIAPVDIITFGSPCQDLSVAGLQKGIHEGARSNLFFEAIRIITEMREATNGEYPKYAVWENVPGAFSSSKGRDFLAVIQAFADVCQPGTVVPAPPEKSGWKHSGLVMGNNQEWSFAWRLFDAQYWGVPQRRKRIYAVCSFHGGDAGDILFDAYNDGVTRNFSEAPDPIIETRLSQILQYDAPERYDLSPKACRGIINRANKRGKELPSMLKDALEEVVANDAAGETSGTDCVSANHAGPAVLCFQLCGDRDNPSLSWSGRSAYCLPANPMSDRGQAVMYENHSQDSRYTGPLKVSQTVSQQFGTGGNNTPIIVEVKR